MRTRNNVPRAFVHPLWWCALALLLLNDHVLKGAGVVPATLTGKASDVAGMLVAPPLLALMLGARRASARWTAAAVVGLLMCAIKLSPAAARALEQALGAIGIPSRIWVDPTDLWALFALPAGVWLSAPAARPLVGRARRMTSRAGIALAAIACMATNGDDEDENRSDSPTLENATGKSVTVLLTSTEGKGGCRIYRDDRIGILTDFAFGVPREITLEAGGSADLADDADTSECGAASIAFANGTREYVFWRDLESIADFVPADDDKRLARRVTLKQRDGEWTFALGDDVSAFELGDAPPESTCEDATATHSLAFSALPMAQGFFEIGELRESDGCLTIDWFAPEGDTTPLTLALCIPTWAFPFEEGETLAVAQETLADGGRTLRITRYDGAAIDTQLVLWNDAATFEGGRIKTLAAIDCVGGVSSCGAYTRPLSVTVRGSKKALHAGDDVSIEGESPVHTRVLIGDARDVAWTSALCTGAEARLGATANALELREY